MKLYFAPMEGITSFAFRQVHHRFFPGMDRYYTPFLAATQTHSFKKKEIREILPENNPGIQVIPQILGNHAEDCLAAIRTLAFYGYREVNFNLGCSMPQVANRGRGAGFLGKPDQLDAFFEELFDGMGKDDTLADVRLSVKTRIGDKDPGEAADLLAIYNRYPICELIVHPRLRTDLYKNVPDMDVFSMFYEECVHPLCYNGDILNVEAYRQVRRRFPDLQAMMLGRGLIMDPSLARQIREAEKARERAGGAQQAGAEPAGTELASDVAAGAQQASGAAAGTELASDVAAGAQQASDVAAGAQQASGAAAGTELASDVAAGAQQANGAAAGTELASDVAAGAQQADAQQASARQADAQQASGAADSRLLESYLLALREGYLTYMQSDQQVLPHIKEIWFYMAWHYDQEIQDSREMKNLRKARSWSEFEQAQHNLLLRW